MKEMLKQILSTITLAAAAVIVATPLAPLRLLTNKKQKKKNDSDE